MTANLACTTVRLLAQIEVFVQKFASNLHITKPAVIFLCFQ